MADDASRTTTLMEEDEESLCFFVHYVGYSLVPAGQEQSLYSGYIEQVIDRQLSHKTGGKKERLGLSAKLLIDRNQRRLQLFELVRVPDDSTSQISGVSGISHRSDASVPKVLGPMRAEIRIPDIVKAHNGIDRPRVVGIVEQEFTRVAFLCHVLYMRSEADAMQILMECAGMLGSSVVRMQAIDIPKASTLKKRYKTLSLSSLTVVRSPSTCSLEKSAQRSKSSQTSGDVTPENVSDAAISFDGSGRAGSWRRGGMKRSVSESCGVGGGSHASGLRRELPMTWRDTTSFNISPLPPLKADPTAMIAGTPASLLLIS